MILVVGATGFLGSEVCRRLLAAGKPVRALVRRSSNPERLAELRNAGATFAEGDLREQSTLEASCQGAAAVISTASAMFSRHGSIETTDRQGQLDLIEAARRAGVGQFVFVSFPAMPEDFPLQRAKREVERALVECGLAHTILQPTFFMEAWLGPPLGFDPANARVRIYGSGQARTSWISYFDVAEFTVLAQGNPAARNMTIPLGGPEALSPLEAVRIFEQFGGRAFQVEHMSEEALRKQRAAATDPIEESTAALKLCCAYGQKVDMTGTLQAFPVRLTSVRDYARRVLGGAAKGA